MQTLRDYLELRPQLPLPDAVAIVRAIGMQVVELHRTGRFHGDICSESVTLDENLRPQLTAFAEGSRSTHRASRRKSGVAARQRERAPASLIARLHAAAGLDTDDSDSPNAASCATAADPCHDDVYALAELLCQMLSGASAEAYLCSPRIKCRVAGELQPLLDRILGSQTDGNSTDASGFLASLPAALAGTFADPAGVETATGHEPQESSPDPIEENGSGSQKFSSLEVVDVTPSCVAGINIGDSAATRRDGPAQAPDLPFQQLGHYQIISRLGHGGMGEVYLGYESGLDRQVAIKVLPLRFARDADLVRRFHAEAMAAAKLVHPNIIQIYYIGEDAGHTFFAMQYVEGMSLARLLSQRRLTLEESLAICDEILSGLAAAHKLGLIHRDIKPGNILLDTVHHRALLADFGLVKSLQESELGHTSSGMILGTADYIAPEQGLGKPIDRRCDLYSMGVVMYQMMCGRLPFIARESTAVIFQHVYVAPQAVSEAAPHIPPGLAAIVEKLLAKSPGDRYQSAAEVLADLRAVRTASLGSRPAVSPGWAGPEHAVPGSAARAASPAAKIETSPIADQATSAGARSPREASTERPDRGRRRVVLAVAAAAGLPALAGGLWFALGRRRQEADERTGDSAIGHSGLDEKSPVEIRRFRDHDSEVNCFVLTHDEALLIVGDRTNKLSVWDFRMSEMRKSFRAHGGPIRRVIITADGKFAVTASTDQTLKLWDLANWKQVTQFNGHVDLVSSVVQVPGRDEIISSSFDGRLRRWSLDKGAPLAWYGTKPFDESESADFTNVDPQAFEQHMSWVRDLVIPVRGDQIISAGNDRVILIWDLDSAQVVDRLIEHRAPVMCLAVSPDGSRLLSGGYDKTLCLWDLSERMLIRHLPHDSATPACVAFSPSGQQALSGGADGLIHIWDVAAGNEQHVIEGHEGTVTSLRYTADGRHIVSGGEDRTVRVWRLPAS